MEIAAILHTHGQPNITLDTIESIQAYMTNKILLLVDGVGWHHYDSLQISVEKFKGLPYGYPRNPYRNIALGLLTAIKRYPGVDWICYLEYDCLIGSSSFRDDLEKLDQQNVWIAGNDLRRNQESLQPAIRMPIIEHLVKAKFNEILYLLGACLFYNKKFLDKLMQEDFLRDLLFYTNDFQEGFFPGYEGPAAWDLMEHLMPTLAAHWGGSVAQFAKWDQNGTKGWMGGRGWIEGAFKKYPIRWCPELFGAENQYDASIIHPLKSYDHPMRILQREKRNKFIQERRICQNSSI